MCQTCSFYCFCFFEFFFISVLLVFHKFLEPDIYFTLKVDLYGHEGFISQTVLYLFLSQLFSFRIVLLKQTAVSAVDIEFVYSRRHRLEFQQKIRMQ
jgi:hypothetical protein